MDGELESTDVLGEAEFKEAINKARGDMLEVGVAWRQADWEVQEKHSELFRDILIALGSNTDKKCQIWFSTSPDIVLRYPEMLIEIGKEAIEKQNVQIIGQVYLSAKNDFESMGLLNSLEFRELIDKLKQKPKLLAEVMLEHPFLQQLSELKNGFFISGSPKEGEGHAWNQIKLDGKWYNMDLTLARDSIVSSNEPCCLLMSDKDFNGRWEENTTTQTIVHTKGHEVFSERRSPEEICDTTIPPEKLYQYLHPESIEKGFLRKMAERLKLSQVQTMGRTIIDSRMRENYKNYIKSLQTDKDGMTR